MAALTAALDAIDRAAPAVLVTVAEVRGSAPREAGTRMLVTADGIAGTIGGGHLEWRAMAAARELLAAGEAARTLNLPLGPTLQQCCGGYVVLELAALRAGDRARLAALIEREAAGRPVVALFGSGHVGRALVAALAALPCRVRWADARGAFPEASPANVRIVADRVAEVPAGAYVLVMTHSHPLDLDLVEAALRRDDLAWVGLIGSETKRHRFEGQLRARGLAQAAIDRLVCPIGIRGIDGKEPGVIAASVAAQLLLAFEAEAARRRLGARSVV